jgi:hypothetical protein
VKSFTLKNGTELPLLSLKGKPYLLVGHRLVWLSEQVANYSIESEFPVLTADETVAHVTVTLYDEKGGITRKATATKRETKKDFPDHTEKAETGAMGRALAMLGFGTQFALADLDEGDRLADAPIEAKKAPKAAKANPTESGSPTDMGANTAPTTNPTTSTVTGSIPSTTKPPRVSSFRKDVPKATGTGGWS